MCTREHAEQRPRMLLRVGSTARLHLKNEAVKLITIVVCLAEGEKSEE